MNEVQTVTDSTGKTYKLFNGTAYHTETPIEVIKTIDRLIQSRTRVRIYFGDTETGKVWNDEHDIAGYIGRSTGTIKIPLLVHNARAYGGGALLDHCILKIVRSDNKNVCYYKNPNIQERTFEIKPSQQPGYNFSLIID